MSTAVSDYVVFLSSSVTEGQTASLVERALTEAGLGVVSAPKLVQAGENIQNRLWKAIAESDAVVVVIDPSRPLPSSTGVEVGAAMAWHKPIYVLLTEAGNAKLPANLGESYPVARIDDLVQSLRRALKPLAREDQEVLAAVYSELGIPADRLLHQPAAIDELARGFQAHAGRQVAGERLVQELLRLRKSGRLPRVGK